MTFRTLRTAAPIFIAVALVSVLLTGCSDRPASPLSLSTAAVAAFLKEQHLDGQIALVQFGNIDLDCEKSREGLDAMIRMNRAGAVAGLTYARVEASPDDDKVQQYYQSKSCGFKVIRDPAGIATKDFQATVVPTVVLVDAFGRVRYRGAFPKEPKLAGWVQTLKEQKRDPGPDVTPFGVQATKPGALLAETKLPDLKDAVKPLSEYQGAGGLVIVFADTTCPFANSALGDMPKVAATLAGLRIPSVVVNISNTRGDVLATYAKRNTGTPVLYDVTDATKENWSVESVPTVVFINANGQVAHRGPAVWKDLGAAVEKSLGLAPGTVKFGAAGTGFG